MVLGTNYAAQSRIPKTWNEALPRVVDLLKYIKISNEPRFGIATCAGRKTMSEPFWKTAHFGASYFGLQKDWPGRWGTPADILNIIHGPKIPTVPISCATMLSDHLSWQEISGWLIDLPNHL